MPGPGCTTPPTWNVGGLSPETEPCEPISRRWAGPQRGTSQPYGDVSQSGPSEPIRLRSWSACGPPGHQISGGSLQGVYLDAGGRCTACNCVLCASHPDRVEPNPDTGRSARKVVSRCNWLGRASD